MAASSGMSSTLSVSEMVSTLVEWADFIMEHGADAALARVDVDRAEREAARDRDRLLASQGVDANDSGTRIEMIRRHTEA